MGRFRDRSERKAEKEQADQVEKETKRLIGRWFAKCIKTGQEWADEKHKEHVAMARANLQPDLMEICGVGDPANIDYDNPHVKLELLMADPVNQRLAHNPRFRDRLYEKMDPETYDVYINYKGLNGETYQDLYESRIASTKAVMYRRKVNKEAKRMSKG